ncbi:MAG TPA: protein kinase [Vicinamibacterales bacterium]|nr:protein kinase [Vicinamibacterales bacterium]
MLARGTRLGPYEIESFLGRGGMGEVYRGRDVRLGRAVALKILAPALVRDEDALARFRREAETASALNHPHILTIYDVGQAEIPGAAPVHYIAMELVEGRTLRQVFEAHPVDMPAALRCFHQVALGLAKAHAAGIIHRDLKPENVILSDDGFAKVVDFGLAKLIASNASDAATMVESSLSGAGLLVGTARYMSPEQAAGQPVDHRTDIFSLGSMLYELAAGHPPFRAESIVETLHRVMHADAPPLAPEISPDLQRITRKCLQKDRARRYQSAAELAIDLADLLESSHATTRRSGAVSLHRPGSSASGRAPVRPPAIVVLPFADLSPGRDHEYVGDGIAEEVTTDLSRLQGLRVIARTSAVQFRGTSKSAAQIAADLGVDYVLTGSVRVAGERMRVTTQLVRAADESSIWSDRLDGVTADIFEIQEQVARAVAAHLRVHISPDESGALKERPLPNVAAFECYLRARRHILDFTEPSLQRALEEIDRAERLVGQNPLLLASKAYVHWQYYNAGVRPEPGSLDTAEQYVDQLEALDPRSPKVDLLRGLIAGHRRRPADAIRHLRRAIQEEPNDVDALTWLVVFLAMVGRPEQARQFADRLRAIDPLNMVSRIAPLVLDYYAGRLEDALVQASRLTPEDMDNPVVALSVMQLRAQAGRIEEAEALARSFAERHPGSPFAVIGLMLVDAARGVSGVREKLTPEVAAVARADMQYSSWIAEIFALTGDADLALDWLDHAVSLGFLNYPWLAEHDRFLDGLRQDPRFAAVLERAHAGWRAVES